MDCRQGAGFGCNENNDKIIKVEDNSFVVQKGNKIIHNLSFCNFSHPYEKYCASSIEIGPKDSIYLDDCNLGVDAEFLAIIVDYGEFDENQGVYKGIVVSPALWKEDEYPQSRYRTESFLRWREPNDTNWKSLGKMMVLTGHSGTPVPTIELRNENRYSVEVNYLIATRNTSSQNLRSDNQFIQQNNIQLIENIRYEGVTSDTPHTVKLTAADQDDAIVVIDEITSMELKENILIIDESSSGKTYLHFVSNDDAMQAHSALLYLLVNRNDHLSSNENGFNLPLERDMTPPEIKIFDDAAFYSATDNAYISTLRLDSFDFTNEQSWTITKENLADHYIQRITDNRDGDMSIYPNEISLKDTDGVSLNEIKIEGNYVIELSLSDLAGNVAYEKILLTISPPSKSK